MSIFTVGKWSFDIVDGQPRVSDGFYADWPVVWPDGHVAYDRPERIPGVVARRVQSWFNHHGGRLWRLNWKG